MHKYAVRGARTTARAPAINKEGLSIESPVF